MLVQAGLCRTCSETTLLVFPRGGSFLIIRMPQMKRHHISWCCRHPWQGLMTQIYSIHRKKFLKLTRSKILGPDLQKSPLSGLSLVFTLAKIFLKKCICNTLYDRPLLRCSFVKTYGTVPDTVENFTGAIRKFKSFISRKRHNISRF